MSSLLAILPLSFLLIATPAAGQTGICSQPGVKKITRLGTSSALSSSPIESRDTLVAFFDQNRSEVAGLMAQKGMSDLVEPLYQALRSGSGVSEIILPAGQIFDWMLLRKGGNPVVGEGPLCLASKRTYDAFEVALTDSKEECSGVTTTIHTFLIPKACGNLAFVGSRTETERAAPVPGPTCALEVTRSCDADGSVFNVDATGSSSGVKVSMAGGSSNVLSSGLTAQVADADPFGTATFTARVASTNKCAKPPVCEKTVTVPPCSQPAPPPPPAPTPPAPTCGWTVRGLLARLDIDDDKFNTESDTERTQFSFGNGGGVGLSGEKCVNPKLGVEAGLLWAELDAHFQYDSATEWLMADDTSSFLALTLGPNLHLTPNRAADFYIGAFIGYASVGDADFNLGSFSVSEDFGSEFVWGAQLGLDFPFGQKKAWGFHVGGMYMDLSASGNQVDVNLDPLIGTLGLSYKLK